MFARFLIVGTLAFLVDMGTTLGLVRAGLSSTVARIPAIAAAMAVSWLLNRHFTFKSTSNRTFREAFRFAVTALAMALLNYAVYLGLIRIGFAPAWAVTAATACQTLVSFFSYRAFVFAPDERRVRHEN